MKIKKNIAVSEAGYLFNPSTGESFSVNPVGVEIIRMLQEGKSEEEISGTLLSEYNTDEATLEKDYTDFIGFLRKYQILEADHE
ncbi:MAG: hypothetical protein Kow00127_18720 [Bacteroidales bacterium]